MTHQRHRHRSKPTWKRIVLMSLGVLAMATMGASSDSKEGTPVLKDLKNVDELRTLFQSDKGNPRLLVLLSPT